LISSSVIASVPNNKRNGVKPIALNTVVLWDQISTCPSSDRICTS
jgi:hypothetical protein